MNRLALFLLLAPLVAGSTSAQTVIAVPASGWRLWLDTSAAWQHDSIYLPGEVSIGSLPVNSPTGGWNALAPSVGIPVSLPATVEQYFWGARGYRRYNNEYAYEKEDPGVRNGNYLGVSWWWRDIVVPASFAGKHAILRIRGARLRAEVFLNEKLVGYNIITELPFECDVTRAVRPGGTNRLAVRITNPGGRLDWVDTELLPWGTTDQKFHKSHGFGGLDDGIELRATDPVYLSDVWVLNTPEVRTVRASAVLRNLTAQAREMRVRFDIRNLASDVVNLVHEQNVMVAAHAEDTLTVRLADPAASLWSNENPVLYALDVSAASKKPSYDDHRSVTFGFRWFNAEEVGNNAILRFNGQRIRVTSAISWGFWGINGLWPTRELAEREVAAAKALGLNCLQFHRNVGKTEMLDAQDRLGLLRYMEPGGGQTSFGEKYSLYAPSPSGPVDVSGNNGEAHTFAERYMEEKIVRMVRSFRSHPSLVMYSIQNEIHPDLHNPRVFRILRRIHEEDPSRIVVVKSGFPSGHPSTNQAWMRPYETTVRYDTGNAVSGWWDDHTVGGPGVWRDELYKGPNDFTHRSTNDSEIVMWGEMLGAAVADNHVKMLRGIDQRGGRSYDRAEHQEILDAYDRFLDRWGFRTAFPTADALFTAIGNKSYDFWGRVIETARLAESTDFFVISGWESTAIENHSGLVDNLRGFKGDPELLKSRLAPVRPVIRARSAVYEVGDSLFVDLYALNESGRRGPESLTLTLTDPSGTQRSVGSYRMPAFSADRFVYPLALNVSVGRMAHEGEYVLRLSGDGTSDLSSTETLRAIRSGATGIRPARVGVISTLPWFQGTHELFPGVTTEPYVTGRHYDLLLAANKFMRPPATQTEPDVDIANTDDDVLYRSINYGDTAMEFLVPGLSGDSATVTLKFAELFQNAVDMRLFDVALNGAVVLKDFDVFRAAGGKNIAVDRIFRVPLVSGTLRITFPNVPKPSARICAFKVESGNTTIAINCGGPDYTDRRGLTWRPYGPPSMLDAPVMDEVRNGMPMIILSEGDASAEAFGKELGRAGVFEYRGYLGEALAPWMGSWYFVREHPLFDGLPVNCAMGSVYQVPVTNGAGLLIDGKNVEIVAAYSRDHSRDIGAGSLTAPFGKGMIIFHSIPGVVSNLGGEYNGIHPILFRRLLANSLKYALR